jgi:hypothetical protein
MEVNDSFWYLTEKLSDIKNRPDPPSEERGAREIVQAVEQVQRAVARYSKAGGQTEVQVWRQLGVSGGLRSADPVPPAVNLTRLRLPNVAQTTGTLDDETQVKIWTLDRPSPATAMTNSHLVGAMYWALGERVPRRDSIIGIGEHVTSRSPTKATKSGDRRTCSKPRSGTVGWEPRTNPKITEEIDEFARDWCGFVAGLCIQIIKRKTHGQTFAQPCVRSNYLPAPLLC